jgi:stage II sporulation protein B
MNPSSERYGGGRDVDKPKSENTITIKINGKNRPANENKSEPISESNKELRDDQTHPPKIVKLEEAAAVENHEEDELFDWILPDEDILPEVKEYKIPINPKKEKRKGIGFSGEGFTTIKLPSLKPKQAKPGFIRSVFIAVFFAVLLGTSFGTMMLRMISTDQVAVDQGIKLVGTETEVKEEGENQQTPPPAVNSTSLTLQPVSTYVVQAGVYTNKDAATSNQQDFKDKGTPSQVVEMDGKFALFVGVADSVENAKKLSSGLDTNGVSTYSKEFTLSEKTISDIQDEEKKLLEITPDFYQSIVTSVVSISTSKSIPSTVKDKLDGQIKAMEQIDKDKLQNEQIKKLQAELGSASILIKTYEKDQKLSTKNEIQQHLLDFLAAYQKL